MEILSDAVRTSRLWGRVATDSTLAETLRRLRSRAAQVAGNVVATQPTMTDHTLRHFDALWGVADEVMTEDETQSFTATEAFLLGSSFYVHDLGMAFGFSERDQDSLRQSQAYLSAKSGLADGEESDRQALQDAIRLTHANRAVDICTKPLDGGEEYLIEDKTDRDVYAHTIGVIASSHHWSLQELDERLASKGIVPIGSRKQGVNLALVAAYLRIIDFAHINSERASRLERALRPTLGALSLNHWKAQEYIQGPIRVDGHIKYASASPIANIDAWWLFYRMVRDLHAEIRSMKGMVESACVDNRRISLRGVMGADSPEDLAEFVEPRGFLPIEVMVRADNIPRVVELLGGRTLYGDSPVPALRELVQNALDAVRLERELTGSGVGHVTVSLNLESGSYWLEIEDNGIGMSRDVVRDYLLAVASNYWSSGRFLKDVGPTIAAEFKPTGKFGIGFLSVFMLGDDVEVVSQRMGSDPVDLRLRGRDQLGELRQAKPMRKTGTRIRVNLVEHVAAELRRTLPSFPLLFSTADVPITVFVDGREYQNSPGEWLKESEFDFVSRAERMCNALRPTTANLRRSAVRDGLSWCEGGKARWVGMRRDDEGGESSYGWVGDSPQILGGGVRVIACVGIGTIVVCCRGIAVQSVPMFGFVGIIDDGQAALDVSRSKVLGLDCESMCSHWIKAIAPEIAQRLEQMGEQRSLSVFQKVVGACLNAYGVSLLDTSALRWIWLARNDTLKPCSSKEFLDAIRVSGCGLIVLGVGPLTCFKLVSGDSTLQGMPIVVLPDAAGHGLVPDEDRFASESCVYPIDPVRIEKALKEDALLRGTIMIVAREAGLEFEHYVSTCTSWEVRSDGASYSRTAKVVVTVRIR